MGSDGNVVFDEFVVLRNGLGDGVGLLRDVIRISTTENEYLGINNKEREMPSNDKFPAESAPE